MSKPRILILMHYMELGGAEMALLGLLEYLDPAKADVDLFVYSHQGPLMNHIPAHVNLLPEIPAYAVIERPVTEALRRRHFGVVAARVLAKVRHRLYRRLNPAKGDDGSIMQYVGNCVTPLLPPINPSVTYDVCISFLTPHNIGRDKVCARRRVAWIHTDYSTMSINPDLELPVWQAFDSIVSISPDVTKSFLKVFPSLAPKIVEFENRLPEAYIRSRANEPVETGFDPACVNLLSIGRFCYAKNYDNVPDIARRIVEAGVSNLRWHIIGYGDDSLIRAKIAEARMENHVIILGKKENPYPYIKAADIYVQPSRYEGKSVTVSEAQLLGTPVVITAYPTAASQVTDGIDGHIVPLDNPSCAAALTALIPELLTRRER